MCFSLSPELAKVMTCRKVCTAIMVLRSVATAVVILVAVFRSEMDQMW